MPTIFRQKSQANNSLGPIRGSVKLLIIKIVFIFLIFDFIYYTISTFFNIFYSQDTRLYLLIASVLLVAYLFTKVFQLGLIIYSVMLWTRTTYYIDGRHLIVHRGVFNIKEDTYDLATIRSADVTQSFIEQLFNFGNIELKTSASGGYQVVVILEGIAKPLEVEKKIKKFF